MADVRTTAFTRVIKEKLFGTGAYMLNSMNHSPFVDNKTVKIPQAGTVPAIVADRSSYPIAVTTRTDDEESYDIVEYSLGALRLTDKDKKELSYNKRASLLTHHMNKLNDRMALAWNYNIATDTAGRHIKTTGTGTANLAPPSGTGTRKMPTLSDIGRMSALFDEDNVPQADRYMLWPAKVYWAFISTVTSVLSGDYIKAGMAKGFVAQILGWNIITRGVTVVYDGSDAKKAVGAAGATGDDFGIICWQKEAATHALGKIEVFYEANSPIYQGDILSALVRFGGIRSRSDEAGTGVIIVEA
jgi:hypothetical protein